MDKIAINKQKIELNEKFDKCESVKDLANDYGIGVQTQILTRRPLKVLKYCFCNRFPFCLNPYTKINRK